MADLEALEYRQPNLTYRLSDKIVAGKADGMEAIQQAIYHILSTERYSNPIYDDDYGIELEQYVGQDIGIIAADIEQTLKDALLQDDRIEDVTVNSVKKSENQNSACVVNFTVFTIYGTIEESLNV